MYLHTITPPDCAYRHHPGITPECPWNLPAITSASPLHHPGIPVTADDCIISLTAGDVLNAEQLAAGLGYCEFLVLMSSSASPPALPHPCLCPLCSCSAARGYIAEEASYRFVWRVCNERGVMTLHIHQMLVFSLDPSVMFLLFFFLPLLGSGCFGRSGT